MLERGAKSPRHFLLMLFLHDENDVCPFDQVGRQRIVRVRTDARRCYFEIWIAGEYLFRRWAAASIFTADKKNIFHQRIGPRAPVKEKDWISISEGNKS